MKNRLLYASFLALGLASSSVSQTAPQPVRFAPTTIGNVKNELFTFVRFGVAPTGPEMSLSERRAFAELVKAQDKAGVLTFGGTDSISQTFTISLPPVQQKSYKALAPKFLDKILSCVRTMPEDSAYAFLGALTGVDKLEATDVPKIKTDLDAALAAKCKGPATGITTKPYEERALYGAESLLTGEFSVWFGGENYIAMLQGLGDVLFGKPDAVFGEAAYDYLKSTLTSTISNLGTDEGLAQLTRPQGFTTFVDFLVIAKTKTFMPNSVIEKITGKCLMSVSDLFKPFSLQVCGSDSFAAKTMAIGETQGLLITYGAE